MKQRIITAVFLILGLIVILALPKIFFSIAITGVLAISIWEWLRITKITGKDAITVVVGSIFFFIALLYSDFLKMMFASLAVINYVFAFREIKKYEKIENYKIVKNHLALSGVIVLPVLAVLLIHINNITNDYKSSLMLLFIILIIAAADSGAYFIGKFFGKNKLSPKVSPKKTKEGLYGGLVTVIITAIVFSFLLNPLNLGLLEIIFISITVSIFSVIGDLYISIIKRQNNIKDSSNILPGHGGVLDRIDGFLAGVPVFYLLVYLFI